MQVVSFDEYMAMNTPRGVIQTTSHPTTPDVNLILETEFRVYDCLIATGFLVCFLIGLPGNCLAFKYFIRTEKLKLADLLYAIACVIDICSSIIHLPVAVNLFSKRRPGAFTSIIFCSMWYFILLLLQQMSMFVVMLISLSRSIIIVCPFYKVSRKVVLLAILVFCLYHCAWNVLWFLSGADQMHYSHTAGYCVAYSESIIDTLYQANYSVCVAVPPIIVFLSILVSVTKLCKEHVTNASERRNRRVSVTMAYFAAIFLFCNFPTFVNSVLFTFTMARYKTYPGPIYTDNFMFFYSWLLTEIFCTVLNASLNPLLYFWRMRSMRLWVLGLIRKLWSSIYMVFTSARNQN